MDRDKAVNAIMNGGPDRVYVREEDGGCIGVPSRVARERYGVNPDIIFLRNDGWSLGATREDTAYEAYNLWKSDWECYMLKGSAELYDISQYRRM